MAKRARTRRLIFRSLAVLGIFFLLGIYILYTWETEVNPVTDSHVYDLPFAKGANYRVVQGYGGLFSHSNIAALDFEMPEGTPIHATRGGTVFALREDSNEGGLGKKYKNKANYIMIRHEDGSYGCYWHLQKDGVVVKKGQRVGQGQLIGYSGATGQVWRPHLHFSVKRRLNYDKQSFVQTLFRTQDGVQKLKRGNQYNKP
jgi:murein DD-endopeptidase MepM/ murein hydrolase activator NlpD